MCYIMSANVFVYLLFVTEWGVSVKLVDEVKSTTSPYRSPRPPRSIDPRYNAMMPTPEPRPLTVAGRRARQRRVAKLAGQSVSSVASCHVYSQSGGAQYGRGSTAGEDLLTVFAEAFERDADPEDFSLDAMIAHECGHQILARHARIAPRMAGVSEVSEESWHPSWARCFVTTTMTASRCSPKLQPS